MLFANKHFPLKIVIKDIHLIEVLVDLFFLEQIKLEVLEPLYAQIIGAFLLYLLQQPFMKKAFELPFAHTFQIIGF